jgi:tetratricopeptide (TPR) repeat protein
VPEQSVDVTRFEAYARPGEVGEPPAGRFERLLAALDEWSGPVLGGRPEWLSLDPAVRALEQARVDCGCRLADLALRLGRAAEAVPRLADLAAAAPYDEPLQARLLRLMHATGRHAEAAREVARVRQRFADDLGVDPSAEVRKAHAAGLRDTGPAVPVPAQLPRDLPDFTGRQRELRAIIDVVLGSSTVPVVAIAGMGGVGKSALAVHAAHQLALTFDDGQLYVDLRGSDQPIAPATVLGWFLGALGVDGSAVPTSLEERVALYRSRTAGRRVLVVIDNAADEQQVRPLIPGSARCAVLVTSRTALVGLAGAHLVDLGLLPAADAVALLGRVAGRGRLAGDPAAGEIVRLCDQLPLAVRIAGSHLAARPRWRLGRLAAALQDEERRLDHLATDDLAVRTSLELSYRGLAPPHQEAFRLLGLLDAREFPAWAAEAALGVPPRVVESYLEHLVAAKLLTAFDEDATGQLRYGFHDLVRLYARERADADSPPEVRDGAVRRALGAWLDLADRADARIADRTFRPLPLPARRCSTAAGFTPAPLVWYESEASALRDAVDQAYAYGFDDLAVALAGSLLVFYELRDRYDDWLHTHQAALRAADRAGDRLGRAVLLRNLAYLGNIGPCREPERDLARASSARDLFAGLGDQAGEADALILYGHAKRHLGDLTGALAAFDEGLRLAREAGHWLGEAALCHVSAIVERERGRLDSALALLARGLALAAGHGNAYQRVLLLRTAGIIERDQGRIERAETCLREALRLAQEIQMPYEEAFITVNLGALEAAAGRPGARERLAGGLALSRVRGITFVEAVGLRTLGELELSEGRLDRALVALRRALELWQALRVPFGEALTWKLLGRAQDAAGDPIAARASLRQALVLFERLDNAGEVAELTGLLARVADE